MKNFKSILFFILSCCQSMMLSGQPKEAKLLSIWHDPTLQSSFYNIYSDVFGYAAKGREYAIIGSTFGTHIIDVTQPTKPKEVARIKGGESSTAVIHRDYDTYRNYLYAVCDEGASTLQIMDLSYLPDSVKVVYDNNSLFIRAHNSYIDTAKAKLYTLSETGYAMGVYDISKPIAPKLLAHTNTIGGKSFNHVHDATVRNDTAYLHCGNDGFVVADFKNAKSPKLLGTLTQYTGAGYNHSGYVSDDGQHYVVADENWGSPLKLIDISKLDDIKVTSIFTAQSAPSQIPHNPIIKGNLVYTAYYYDGLQVHDISDPAQPKRVAYYDSCLLPDANSYAGAWGVYPLLPSGNVLLADMQRGLFVIENVGKLLDTKEEDDSVKESRSAQVFPQPADEVLNLKLNLKNNVKNLSLSLFDAQGKCVTQAHFDNLNEGEQTLQLDIKKIMNGFYLLQAANQELNVTCKVVIAR